MKINKKGYKPLNKPAPKTFFEKYIYPIRILICLSIILLIAYFILKAFKFKFILRKGKQSLNKKDINPEEILYQIIPSSILDSNELKEINNFINKNKLNNPDEISKKYENPKISIIMLIYNGEKYLEKSLLSIYNQYFKEIEVIIINDYSNDKTQEIINKLKSKYPSISLFTNNVNKGMLNSTITGIINSKGKYILFLHQNDFFAKKNAFEILYSEAEKNNLDVLGFSSLIDNGKYISHFNEIPLIKQPIIKQIMYNVTKDGVNISRTGNSLFNYFIKTELIKNIIKEIDEKYSNEININYISDFFLLFMLSRNATTFKQIKNILYYSSNNLHKKWEEEINLLNLRCSNYLYYLYFLYNKTNDNKEEKKIVLYELENFILNTKCRKNDFIRNELVKLCKNLTEKNYVDNKYKLELYLYIFENVTVLSQL